jgi:hypothetical protein
MLLDVREELLDLLGREVVDRNGLEQIVGGDEATLPALEGELILDLVDRGSVGLGLEGGFAHGSFLGGRKCRCACTARTGYRT